MRLFAQYDKTISIIPTHKLIDSSFKNWRGMNDSGGRRIKRSINIFKGIYNMIMNKMDNNLLENSLIRVKRC